MFRVIQMDYREALRVTMTMFRLKGKDLAATSGLSQNQISAFRNGGDLYVSSFQALLNAMPEDAQKYFYGLVSTKSVA